MFNFSPQEIFLQILNWALLEPVLDIKEPCSIPIFVRFTGFNENTHILFIKYYIIEL